MTSQQFASSPAGGPVGAADLAVPPGRWAVGVSGGVDSVALLLLLRERGETRSGPDRETPERAGELHLHVVHLDHETRGAASTGDAEFVRDLAGGWGLPCTIARRGELEAELQAEGTIPPANPSARYRALRHELFRRVAAARQLQGVILAHHADDQAETVLHRLLRGSGPAGLAGMSAVSEVGGLTLLRPLLGVRRAALRRLLLDRGQSWREDASNASDRYVRNVLRRLLSRHPLLADDLLTLGETCRGARNWVRARAPELAATFPAAELAALPVPLARESARRWLMCQGVPPAALDRAPAAMDRLVALAADVATAPSQHFPGGLRVRRRGGIVWADATTIWR